MTVLTGTITGQYANRAGGPARGVVTVVPSVPIVRADGEAGPVLRNDYLGVPVALDPEGTFTIEVPASSPGAGIDPEGVTYAVRAQLADGVSPAPVVGLVVPAGQVVDVVGATPVNPDAPVFHHLTFDVETGDPGSDPDLDVTGPAQAPHLTFTLPAAPTVEIGPVTTGAPGTPASVQNAGTDHEVDLRFTIPQGDKGDTGNPTAFELRGTGSPEGVVTANPGTYYTDTAGTTGAWRWMKATGTGNTGWVVLFGDTGWRGIESLINADVFVVQAGFAGRALKIRRVNNRVELAFSINTVGALATGSTPGLLTSNGLPGFNASPASVWAEEDSPILGPAGTPAGANLLIRVSSQLLMVQIVANLSAGALLRHRYSWYTADPWPAVLPGIPK